MVMSATSLVGARRVGAAPTRIPRRPRLHVRRRRDPHARRRRQRGGAGGRAARAGDDREARVLARALTGRRGPGRPRPEGRCHTAAERGGRVRHLLAHLHRRHDGPAQGRDGHPPGDGLHGPHGVGRVRAPDGTSATWPPRRSPTPLGCTWFPRCCGAAPCTCTRSSTPSATCAPSSRTASRCASGSPAWCTPCSTIPTSRRPTCRASRRSCTPRRRCRRPGWPMDSSASDRCSRSTTPSRSARPPRCSPSATTTRRSRDGCRRAASRSRRSASPCSVRTTRRSRSARPARSVSKAPAVMDGYWKQPELTAETIRDGWLHTGDMATCDDEGFLTIVDRKKDMIVTGGFNVFPREIEDVLTSHPAVAGAAVIGVPDDKWGEAVTALVVTRPGQDVPPERADRPGQGAQGQDRRAQGGRVHRRHPAHPGRQGRQALAARPLLDRQRSVGALARRLLELRDGDRALEHPGRRSRRPTCSGRSPVAAGGRRRAPAASP